MSSDKPGNGNSKEVATQETLSQIHSANSWETADLGDTQRKEKFLRLMGASKKEHHGKFIIGDQKPAHKRDKPADRHVADELEEQYEHSMGHRLASGRRGHLGLGYHPDDAEKTTEASGEQVDPTVDAAEDDSTNDDSVASSCLDTGDSGSSDKTSDSRVKEAEAAPDVRSHKRESLDKSSDSAVKKMKFVQSDSD